MNKPPKHAPPRAFVSLLAWYSERRTCSGERALARAIDVAPALVWQIAAGQRRIPPSWVERLISAGARIGITITPEELRPDYDWIRAPSGDLYWRAQK